LPVYVRQRQQMLFTLVITKVYIGGSDDVYIMKVTRKLMHTSKLGRSLMIPSIFLEQFREKGIEVDFVIVDIKDDELVITPVLPEKKKK